MTTRDNGEVTWVPASAVRRRYGGANPVSDMTLWRWVNDPSMRFPQPTYFGRLRFWRLDELEDWERQQPRGETRERAALESSDPAAA